MALQKLLVRRYFCAHLAATTPIERSNCSHDIRTRGALARQQHTCMPCPAVPSPHRAGRSGLAFSESCSAPRTRTGTSRSSSETQPGDSHASVSHAATRLVSGRGPLHSPLIHAHTHSYPDHSPRINKNTPSPVTQVTHDRMRRMPLTARWVARSAPPSSAAATDTRRPPRRLRTRARARFQTRPRGPRMCCRSPSKDFIGGA